MNELAPIAYYGTIACAVAIPAIGVGIGQGLTSSAALDAINMQPAAQSDITKTAILSMALIETAALMGTFVAMLLMLAFNQSNDPYAVLSVVGIASAVCLPGLIVGLTSSRPAQAACYAVARQPFYAADIIRFMLITLSLIQTPIIFGIIVALFIQGQAPHVQTMRDCMRLIASGLAIGLGSIGPAIGLSTFAQKACRSISAYPKQYRKIVSFTFISEAVIETPIIFSFLISIMLLLMIPASATESLIDGVAYFSAALCIGIGTFGPGIASGNAAAAACEQIAIQPAIYATLSRLTLFSQGIIETCTIYALLISFLLLFFT